MNTNDFIKELKEIPNTKDLLLHFTRLNAMQFVSKLISTYLSKVNICVKCKFCIETVNEGIQTILQKSTIQGKRSN